jgi:FkbM family methyltransferase
VPFSDQTQIPSGVHVGNLIGVNKIAVGTSQMKRRVVLGENAKAITRVVLTKCVTRRNLARIARFLTNTARLDGANDMRANGENLVQETVLRHFPTNCDLVVFDVGANVGEWSIQLLKVGERRHESNSFLYAFEPVSSTMQRLQENLQTLKIGWKVLAVQKALSDRQGTTQIYVVEEGCGINAITPDARQAIKRTETIELKTVDDYCQTNNISEIALLKIDAEGHDLFVLRGARQLLNQKRIHVIQFEYNFRWVWSRATLFDVFEYADAIGYRVGKVTPKGIEFYNYWDPELEKFVEGNYLLCRPDWIEKFPHVPWWKTN